MPPPPSRPCVPSWNVPWGCQQRSRKSWLVFRHPEYRRGAAAARMHADRCWGRTVQAGQRISASHHDGSHGRRCVRNRQLCSAARTPCRCLQAPTPHRYRPCCPMGTRWWCGSLQPLLQPPRHPQQQQQQQQARRRHPQHTQRLLETRSQRQPQCTTWMTTHSWRQRWQPPWRSSSHERRPPLPAPRSSSTQQA